jgi:hypothetical protein
MTNQMPDPELRAGQMWDTSIGRIAIMKDPEPNLHGGFNVEHARNEGESGWISSGPRSDHKWAIGPDREEVKFHSLFHDRRKS